MNRENRAVASNATGRVTRDGVACGGTGADAGAGNDSSSEVEWTVDAVATGGAATVGWGESVGGMICWGCVESVGEVVRARSAWGSGDAIISFEKAVEGTLVGWVVGATVAAAASSVFGAVADTPVGSVVCATVAAGAAASSLSGLALGETAKSSSRSSGLLSCFTVRLEKEMGEEHEAEPEGMIGWNWQIINIINQNVQIKWIPDHRRKQIQANHLFLFNFWNSIETYKMKNMHYLSSEIKRLKELTVCSSRDSVPFSIVVVARSLLGTSNQTNQCVLIKHLQYFMSRFLGLNLLQNLNFVVAIIG